MSWALFWQLLWRIPYALIITVGGTVAGFIFGVILWKACGEWVPLVILPSLAGLVLGAGAGLEIIMDVCR